MRADCQRVKALFTSFQHLTGIAGIEEELLPGELFCLTQVSYIRSLIEQRLHNRAYRTEQPTSGIDYNTADIVRPSGRAGKSKARIKSGTGGIGSIICLCQIPFRLSHIRTVGKQPYGKSGRKCVGKLLLLQCSPHDVM